MTCQLNTSNTKKVEELVESLGSTEAAVKFIREQTVENIRKTELQAAADERLFLDIDSHVNGVDEGFTWTMTPDPEINPLKKAIYDNVETLENIIAVRYKGQIGEALSELRTNVIGLIKNKQFGKNLVNEMGGIHTGDSMAARLAPKLRKVFDDMRIEANEAGFNIPYSKNFYPSSHDAVRIGKAGSEQYIADLKELLDIAEIQRRNPGIDIDEAFLAKYHKLTGQRDPNASITRTSEQRRQIEEISERHQESRFLIFKSTEDQLAYNTKYGSDGDDVGGTIINYINAMANELALVKRFGPTPADAIRALQDKGVISPSHRTGVGSNNEAIQKIITREADEVENILAADIGKTLRDIEIASKLGSTLIASISDTHTIATTAGLWDLPVFGSMISIFKGVTKEEAAHIGFLAQNEASRASAINRFADDGDQGGLQLTSRLAEGVIRIGGVMKWTDAGRKNFMFSTARHFGEMADTTFENLPKGNRDLLSNYGITAKDWDIVRVEGKAKFENGLDYVVYDKIADRNLQDRWLGMMLTEMDQAIPAPNARTRGYTTFGGAKKGTLAGEVGRAVGQLKSYPLQIMLNNAARAVNAGRNGSKGLCCCLCIRFYPHWLHDTSS